MHSANLAARFLLELAALAGFAVSALHFFTGNLRYLAAVAAVIVAAAIWGTFAVPGDPSRSGNAPVVVPGWLRLTLEFAILFGGAIAFWLANHPRIAAVMALLVVVHYALWPSRITWLLQQ